MLFKSMGTSFVASGFSFLIFITFSAFAPVFYDIEEQKHLNVGKMALTNMADEFKVFADFADAPLPNFLPVIIAGFLRRVLRPVR